MDCLRFLFSPIGGEVSTILGWRSLNVGCGQYISRVDARIGRCSTPFRKSGGSRLDTPGADCSFSVTPSAFRWDLSRHGDDARYCRPLPRTSGIVAMPEKIHPAAAGSAAFFSSRGNAPWRNKSEARPNPW